LTIDRSVTAVEASMTSTADPTICTAEGCTADAGIAERAVRRSNTTLELRIISDTICPWCYVGKRRIEQALEELAAEGLSVTTQWLPFELNPKMPAAGMDRREYRSAKFGSWDRSQTLDAQVAAEGAREGIVFRHDLIERTPNTRASHRLIWLGGELGGPELQNRVVEELFSAYFCQGRDIGDLEVLIDIGSSAGLPASRMTALLASNDGIVEVLQREMWGMSAGIRGVPSVVAGNLLLFSGAQRTPLIVKALREVASAHATDALAGSGEAQADARA
jgi:predicted DsbA family dithiol-disulfide isomerase